MGTMKKAVGGIRLSSMTEDTTSPARQRQMIEQWSGGNDAEIVGWAEDLDVSAGIAPWDRPELGQWLNEKSDQFDVLVFAKLDRAVRSLNDFIDLDRMLTAKGVSLVILDPALDLTDMWGRAMAQILAVFAELERQMIRKRTKEGYEELLRIGRWPGGRVAYGYKIVRRPGEKGWWLTIDNEQAEVLRTIIGRIINGASTRSQVLWLNDQGIPPARESKAWQHTALYDMLKSRTLLGQRPKGDDVERDERGMPIVRAEPIVDLDTWEHLQETLRRNSTNKTGNRHDAAPLLRVAFCGICQRPMYRRRFTQRGKEYMYYQCGSKVDSSVETCPVRPFRGWELEKIVFDEFLAEVGPSEVMQRVYVPGEDHSDSLKTAQGAYEDLTTQLSITKSSSARKTLSDRLTALDELISDLETKPSRSSSWEYEGTGETYEALWGRLSDPERGALLRNAGVQAFVDRLPNDQPICTLVLPWDMEEKLRETQ